MPVSKRRRKKTKPKQRDDFHDLAFSRIQFDEGRHEEFKAAVIEASRKSVGEFPNLLERISRLLSERYPPGILSTFAFYGCQATVDSEGRQQSMTKDILQHHVELLQALVLMLPVEKWGGAPSTGEVMQTVFDTMPEIADSFFKARLLQHAEETDPQKQAGLSLQEKIRLHTQAVRNWGYYHEVLKICRELYSPLDSKFAAALGFSATDLIDIAQVLVAEFEGRARLQMEAMRGFIQGRTIPQVVKLYYQHMPDLKGSPEEFLKRIPPGTPREGVVGLLMSHADLRHEEIMTFTAADIATLTQKSCPLVEKVLDSLSMNPGDLTDAKPEHLFLANPVWIRPAIKLPSGYLVALPQAIFSHINSIIRSLADTAGIRADLSDRRAAYLEDKIEELLRLALPTARIEKNRKWSVDGVQYETDIIALLDRTLIIAEAKSHRVSPEALRGAPDRLRRHLAELVVEPSVQSERLQSLVTSARGGDAKSEAIVAHLGIDASNIDNIIRLSVTLDDFSIISSSEKELKEVGWIPSSHALAPTILIADLICIAEVLGNELQFIHYLSERFHFQKSFELLGDELDFLGLYLSTGFNVAGLQRELARVALTGLSEPIDRYYQGREAGLELPRPKSNLHRTYREIVDRLVLKKPPSWTTIGIHLLNSANADEQKKVAAGLERLRASVLRNHAKLGHECCMQIIPPLDRKATIAFFVYNPDGNLNVRNSMEQIAADSLEREEARVCVVFGKSTDSWAEPYQSVLVAQKQ